MDSAEAKAAKNERGDWKACIDRIRDNDAKAVKCSFKHLEPHSTQLGQALAENTKLRYLDLSCNSFSPVRARVGTQCLCGAGSIVFDGAAIGTIPSPELVVCLRCNGAWQVGAAHFSSGLYKNTNLIALDLSANALQSAGTKSVVKALGAHPTLRWLDLHANCIRDDAVNDIVALITQSKSLRSLNIRANYFTDETVDLLASTLHTYSQ